MPKTIDLKEKRENKKKKVNFKNVQKKIKNITDPNAKAIIKALSQAVFGES